MRSATLSADGRYRYLLERRLGDQSGVATFIMLNPSTADAERDDPTIRKCMGFTRLWGCGLLRVVNLFALRATHPVEIARAADPVGPRNARYIRRAVEQARLLAETGGCGPVVCAWGVHGSYRDQDRNVLRWLERLSVELFALGLTREGHPRHPLYVPYSALLIPFSYTFLLTVSQNPCQEYGTATPGTCIREASAVQRGGCLPRLVVLAR